MATDDDFAALAERVTDASTPTLEGSEVAAGSAAAAQGRDLMLREYGSRETLDAVLRKAGRTQLGTQPKGASPTVRGRLPEADFAALKSLEQRTGKNQSELLREAVQLLLAEHKIDA